MYKCPVDDVGHARDGGGKLCVNVLSAVSVTSGEEMEEDKHEHMSWR